MSDASLPPTRPQLHLILDLGSGIAWNHPDPSKLRHAIIDLPPDAPDLPETFDVIVDHTRAVLAVLEEAVAETVNEIANKGTA